MKKNFNIEKMSDQEWADAAAWLSDEETGSENAAHPLLQEDPDLQKKWNDMKMADPGAKIDVDKAWARLDGKISAETDNVKVRRLTLIPALLRVAAMVIIVFGLGWFVFEYATPDKVTVASAENEKNISVTLPDGSSVFLNRGSYLTYPENFGRNNRKVSLKGEAFFDIQKDPSKPFTIDAGKARVRVLGTSFNVITDNGNNEVEVYVSTGTVMLTSSDGSRSLTLEPGFIGKISDISESRLLNTNANYLSWNTETLTYNGETLDVVLSDLKRVYNIDITISDPEISNYRLTTVFDNQPHDTIIKVICTTFNLRSVKEGDIYSLSRR